MHALLWALCIVQPTMKPRLFLAHVKQWLCKHACEISDIRRISEEAVICPCRKCGKMLTATYGLALPAVLENLKADNRRAVKRIDAKITDWQAR